MRPPYLNEIDRSARSGSRKCTLPRPGHRPLWQVVGHADNRELRRVCVYETRQPKGRGLEAVALHVVALNPLHSAQIDAHGEGGSEDLAHANSNIPAVIGVSLSRTSRIVGAEESSLFVFVFLLVGKSSVEPGLVAEVVVNAAAVLVRIVCQKADRTPVVRQRTAQRGGIKVNQLLADRVDERRTRKGEM